MQLGGGIVPRAARAGGSTYSVGSTMTLGSAGNVFIGSAAHSHQ